MLKIGLKALKHHTHIRHWIGIITLMSLSFGTLNLQHNAGFLKSSVLDLNKAPAFDGTVAPIQIAPDWTNLSASDAKLAYSEISKSSLEEIPEYRSDYISFPSEDLVWGNDEHDIIRNTKISYPVGWTDNYMIGDDSYQGGGSHPAIDIKVPKGTPVHAIANAVVTESGFGSGWGYHVVLRHDNVPLPNNPDTRGTLYSSYSHLDRPLVAEGETVYRNQVIGEVGNTGTATTYHLHFQLDSSEAPWHPYWPFTTAEANEAGYDFWDAVNYGVGIDNVLKYTYDPLKWVYAHENSNNIVSPDPTPTPTPTPIPTPTPEPEPKLDEEAGFESIKIVGSDFMEVGATLDFRVELLDERGQVIELADFSGDIEVFSSDNSVISTVRNKLRASDFQNGWLDVNVYAHRAGKGILSLKADGKTWNSAEIIVIDGIQAFGGFGLLSDGTFSVGSPEKILVRSEDIYGNPTPSFKGTREVLLSLSEGQGSLSPSTLTKDDFYMGIAEVTFTPADESQVTISLEYGAVKESISLNSRLFQDFDSYHENFNAVQYLYKKGTVSGYPDNTFRPDLVVNRVEVLKLIYRGIDKQMRDDVSFSFNDTDTREWYAAALGSAVADGVVEGYSDGSFKPTQGVNNVEFLKMLLEVADVNLEKPLRQPYLDVDTEAWFAPYVAYAKEKNIYQVEDNYFKPGEYMNRAAVTESIYRLIVVLQNGGNVSYSEDLRVQ